MIRVVLLAALLIGGDLAGAAPQIAVPALPGLTVNPEVQPAGAEAADQAAARVRERLRAAQTEAARIEGADLREVWDAPADVPEQDLEARRLFAQQLERTLEDHLNDLRRLEEARAQYDALSKQVDSWKGLDQPPPYPIPLVDGIRDELASVEGSIGALESQRSLIEHVTKRWLDDVREAGQRLRQAQERYDEGRKGPDAERLAWQRDYAAAASRYAQAHAAGFQLKHQLVEAQLESKRLARDFAQRRLDAAASAGRLSDQDMQQVRAGLEAERRDLRRETERVIAQDAARRKPLAVLDARIESERTALTGLAAGSPAVAAASGRLKELQAERELAALEVDSIDTRRDMLNVLRAVIEYKAALWESRYKLFQRPTQEERLRTGKMLERIIEGTGNWTKYLTDRLEHAGRSLDALFTRRRIGLPSTEEALVPRRFIVYAEQEESLRRAHGAVDSLGTLAERMTAELGQERGRQDWIDRLASLWVRIKLAAQSVWGFELVAVEDTIEVDGEKVTGTRSVTLGKVIQALALFALLWYGSKLLGRSGERLAIRRFGMDADRARLLRRWLHTLGMVIVFVAVLLWVKIPFAVFAFLGGAVAIGLGFGMQTMLKNLISGLMILGERPFRLGDIVEVGGIRGTVTAIGVRSSTILDQNGIETLVPNSIFLEQNLTNWTYSSGQVRFVIRVGVAYGSDQNRVRGLLMECAQRHGRVLKEPPPEVLFEDFGTDSLLFALYVWIDLKGGGVAREIQSDLRCMIAESFGKAGIVIAFPQRDIHLDSSTPLRVELIGG